METRINVKYWLQSMFLRRRENHYDQVVLSILMEIKNSVGRRGKFGVVVYDECVVTRKV